MFPKGQQKKTDTVVVMVDGKSPQTIPTMDSPPEPQKIPKCRLLVVLTIILILALVLLAGYCAWLFFSYETDILPFKQTHDPDFIIRPTKLSEDDDHVTTAPPKVKDDVFSRPSAHNGNILYSEDGDFGFSDSSYESVYDSSEPYGSSEQTFPSWSWSDDVVSSYESEALSSLSKTTKKGDRYLWDGPRDRLMDRWERLKELLKQKEESGDYGSGDSEWSYDSSSLLKTGEANELPFHVDESSYSESWVESSRFSSEYPDSTNDVVDGDDSESWVESSRFSSDYPDSTYGVADEYDWFSEYTREYYSGLDDDDSSSEYGSGESFSYYDVFDDFRGLIPQHVTEPPFIDSLPPERIAISVCSWPSRIFGRRNEGESRMMTFTSDRLSCIYDNSFSLTAVNDKDGSSLTRAIWLDFENSIIAVNINNHTAKRSSSECYISFFPSVPETDDSDYFGSGDYDSWDDEMEGSGRLDEVDPLGQKVVIKNPILLGDDIWMMSTRISNFCSHSTKFWATSITVKEKVKPTD